MFYDASMYWCKNLNFGRVIIMPAMRHVRLLFFSGGGGGYNFIQLAYYRSFLVFEKILIFILIKFYGSLCNLYLLGFFSIQYGLIKKKRTSQTAKPHPTLIPKIQMDNIFMQSSPRNMKSAHFCIIVILVPF